MTRTDDYFYDYQYNRTEFTWALTPKDCTANEAIIKGILNEASFDFSISHNYGSNSMLGGLTNAVTGLMKGARNADALVDAVKGPVNALTQGLDNPVITKFVNSFYKSQKAVSDFKISGLTGLGNDNTEATLGSLVWGSFTSMINHIKYYDGSTTNFTIPRLNTIYFDDDDDESIGDRISRYNNYFMGKMYNPTIYDNNGNQILGNGIIGFMQSPSSQYDQGVHYKPSFNSSTTDEFPGTFRLYIGDKYMISNLIITDYSVSLSTTTHRGANNRLQPLYAEISLSVAPAGYIDDEKLKSCINFM